MASCSSLPPNRVIVVPSFWKFRRHGESGLWMSDLFPQLAAHVDKLAFIYSMHSKTALHGPACFMMNTGFTLPGFPSMGSWVTYGLGSENDDLPSFVVLPDPRGLPPGGIINWGAGFLPATYQATTFAVTRTELSRSRICFRRKCARDRAQW